MSKLKISFSALIATFVFLATASVASAAPRLILDPSTKTVTKNQEFDVKVNIDVESQAAFGSDAVLNFDTSALTLKSVSSGGFFSDFANSSTNGRLELHGYFAGVFDSKSGTGTFANLKFQALKDTSITNITFTCTSSNETQILNTEGNNILTCSSLNQSAITMTVNATTPPSGTTQPTNTPNPTSTPQPTVVPTATPKPSATPSATKTPSPTPQVVELNPYTPPTEAPSAATPETQIAGTARGLFGMSSRNLIVLLGLLAVFILGIILFLVKRNGDKKDPEISPITTITPMSGNIYHNIDGEASDIESETETPIQSNEDIKEAVDTTITQVEQSEIQNNSQEDKVADTQGLETRKDNPTT